MDPNLLDELAVILTALTAIFTLVIGAGTIAAGFLIVYFAKLKRNREKEIQELAELQDKIERKFSDLEGKKVSEEEIERLKKDYRNLRNRFIHSYSPLAAF